MQRIKIVFFILLFSIAHLQAQESDTRWYAGAQAGVPLFWGDIRSLADKTHLGFGGGLFVGYKTKWLSPEIGLDYGFGKLGPQTGQLNDYFNSAGAITYMQNSAADRKLGDVYVKTNFLQAGLRLGVSLTGLFSPGREHKVDIDVAPVVHAQKFSPAVYTASGSEKLAMGITDGGWDYAVGGDVGLSFMISSNASLLIRSGLLWLNNTTFDGLDNHPVWRVNTMLYNRVGVVLNLGKKK